jgi:hypothetical protein
MMRPSRSWLGGAAAAGALLAAAVAGTGAMASPSGPSGSGGWVGTWATGDQPLDHAPIPPGFGLISFSNATLREIVHVSAGGQAVRVRPAAARRAGARQGPGRDRGDGAPFHGFFNDLAKDAQRDAVNQFIRTSPAFDGVADFDRALRDPADPERMLAAFDSGDGLHPNDAGDRAMAGAVDLRLLR